MAKTKVRLELNGFLGKLEKGLVINRATKAELGKTVQEITLKMISRGQSPVKGVGRFAAYAAQRLKETKAKNKLYPYSVRRKFPQKKLRPVNLYLDGSYLKTLGYEVHPTDNGVMFGHFKMSSKQKKMFETHNEGQHKHVPQRKYLPTKGADYTISVYRALKEVVLRRIRSML